MPASLKGWCVHCRGEIDGSAVRRNVAVPCPHCGREVVLSSAVAYRKRFRPDRGTFWAVVAGVTITVLAVLSYVFWRQIKSGFYLLADETGGTTAAVVCLAVALFLLLCMLFWMLLPFVLYAGLRDLRRRTSELEETGRLCARHLARLSDERSRTEKEHAPD